MSKGGRTAKQAPRTPSRPRQESVNNNQNREEINHMTKKRKKKHTLQMCADHCGPRRTKPWETTRSSADDTACRKPAIGKHVVDVPADRNLRDVLKLSSAKTTVNIGSWNVRSLLGSGKSDLLVKEVAKIEIGCSWSSRVALEGSRSPGS